jgi:hypothetical protein
MPDTGLISMPSKGNPDHSRPTQYDANLKSMTVNQDMVNNEEARIQPE